MNNWMKAFLAFASVIGGTVCIVWYLAMWVEGWLWISDYTPVAVAGVVLVAAGAAYFRADQRRAAR